MLKLRKRGRIYHVRGTVRIGSEKRIVKEHTTGCGRQADAEAYTTRLASEIRADLLDGRKVGLRRLTFADAGLAYIKRPGVHPTDVWRIGQLNKHMGDFAVGDAKEAWRVFRERRCGNLKPASIERFRKVAQAALNLLGAEHDFEAPKLPTIKVENERVRFLTKDEQEQLLAAYTPHVGVIALFLCYTGARTQEALQLKWRHVDFARNTVFFDRTKNGEPRTVPLHPRVRKHLEAMQAEREPVAGDHVFLNRFGEPYADTRDYKLPGGNPIGKAHRTACKRAKIDDFTPHDWRHHWASQHVMAGTDLETLRRMGGWKSLEMVQRYVAVSDDHMQEAVKRIA